VDPSRILGAFFLAESPGPRVRRPHAGRMIRLRLDPSLTPREARAMKERAAEDMRSIGNFVAWSSRRTWPESRGAAAPGRSSRTTASATGWPSRSRGRIARCSRSGPDAELRSLSNYVATLILEDLV
jgi:hypothetical protein